MTFYELVPPSIAECKFTTILQMNFYKTLDTPGSAKPILAASIRKSANSDSSAGSRVDPVNNFTREVERGTPAALFWDRPSLAMLSNAVHLTTAS